MSNIHPRFYKEQPAHPVKLFNGRSNIKLAQDVAAYLNIPLGNALVSNFANGETRVKIDEMVRGSRVFVIQPTCGNVNDSLMELLIMIDALKRASAHQVCAVIPYFGYAKQEKKVTGREPITAKLVANLITTAGADRVITVDLHAPAIQGFFDIPTDNLKALPTLAEHYKEKGLVGKDVVVVSPDAGGVTRATELAERLKARLAIIFKRRPEPDQTEVIDVVGKIKGCRAAIIIDDMISTGGTLALAVEQLVRLGAQKVYTAVTHAILAGKAVDILSKASIEELLVTDTIPLSEEALAMPNLKVISLAPLLGEAIKRTHHYESISALFN